MISLSDRPPPVILSKNPAWFAVTNTGESKKVKATVKKGASTIASQYAYASVNNIARFELSEYFHHAVKPSLPFLHESGSIITQHSIDTVQKLTVTFSDDNDNSFDQAITVIHGELSPDLALGINYGTGSNSSVDGYLSLNPLLSLKPDQLYVRYENQPERLSYFAKAGAGTVSVALTIHFVDGSNIVLIPASFTPAENTLHIIKTSYAAIVKPNIPGSKADVPISSYTITVSSPQHLPATFRYQVAFTASARGSFVFLNSLGGLDTFCPTGVNSISSSVSAKLSRVNVTPGWPQPLYRTSERKLSETIKQNTGFVDADHLRWLSQMIFSKKAVWVPRDGVQIPISFVNNKLDFKSIISKLYSAEVSYVYNPDVAAEFMMQ